MDERVDRAEADVEPAPLSRETRVTRPPRLRRLVIPVVLIAASLGIGWYWWTHRAPQPTSRGATAQAAPQPVGAATIDKGDIRIVLNELGTVTPLATVTVKTQINGQLVDVAFKEGQVVKKGDFLAQIDPRPFQVTLEQAQGQLAHDQGLLQQAQTNLKRFQTLGRQDSIAQQQVDDQRYLVAQDIGTVQSDQAQVDSANLNLTYCHIVSPIEGQIGLRQVDAGNYVQTSDANGVVVITQMQPISVIFSVPEDNLPDIIQRLHTGATLSVEAYDRANVRKLATGQLGTLDNQIDTTTGTLKLRAMFDNPDELLYPNQFVNARLLVNTMQDTVRVPVPAVQRGEPGTFVYVINANNTVSVRPVKLGPTDGGYAAVLSGLQPGDKVVTDGTDRLRDGAAVTVPAPGQTPGQLQGRAGQAAQPGQTAQPGQPAQPSQTPPEPGQRPDGQRGQRHSTQPQ
ncbi:MAG TPA: MdtA/MuxA family multidrug efflux RND transporter periplasmic adaptor subunit [Acetobacteraceae bacterium]|jgi:multidrug efflux system membrane fusion protein|nr:MdtA/MuxA family multidrug efflux RND transporter periplasmic adaptor subunit [Acetobacteraceae bacterium]